MTRDWADAPFVRVYNTIFEDEKFSAVRGSLFEWYVRLLLNAKLYYPTRAPLPRSTPQRAINVLTEAGVIESEGDFYTVCGLAKEMADVPDHGRAGGLVRAATAQRAPDGSFRAGADAPTIEVADGRADLEAFVEVRRKAPTPRQRQVLDNILERHDVSGPAWAATIILANPNDPIGAVIEADKAWRADRKAGAIADEQASAQRKRRGFQDPHLQELARHLAMQEAEREPVVSQQT